ncbi:DnaJ subfamily C member 30, mitochondrial [Diaporthe australafricana]|uniref:DnaJ subfamily C member 30, mitochondrial n=1 Tax=Diaporthe australafricana TaxID=127596 RepID=A0ABR3XAU6_9PEZI
MPLAASDAQVNLEETGGNAYYVVRAEGVGKVICEGFSRWWIHTESALPWVKDEPRFLSRTPEDINEYSEYFAYHGSVNITQSVEAVDEDYPGGHNKEITMNEIIPEEVIPERVIPQEVSYWRVGSQGISRSLRSLSHFDLVTQKPSDSTCPGVLTVTATVILIVLEQQGRDMDHEVVDEKIKPNTVTWDTIKEDVAKLRGLANELNDNRTIRKLEKHFRQELAKLRPRQSGKLVIIDLKFIAPPTYTNRAVPDHSIDDFLRQTEALSDDEDDAEKGSGSGSGPNVPIIDTHPYEEGDRLYELLGVPRTATQAEITKACRKKILLYHPDKIKSNGLGIGEEQANYLTNYFVTAKLVLTDPEHRAKYDMAPGPGPGAPRAHLLGFY